MKTFITILCWFIPFKKLRKRLKVKYIKTQRIKYHDNNQLLIYMPDGSVIKNPSRITGLTVCFNGANSIIKLFYPITFHSSRFFVGDNCDITIQKSCLIGMTIDTYNKSSVFIDENCQIGECYVCMANESGTSLKIGKDCVFSTGIEIWTTDTHPIFDKNGKCINNKKSCVQIGNNVWICRRAILLKGARIPDGAIIGNSSVCANKLTQPGCVYAGNPCNCVKKDITWHVGKID